MPTFKTVTETTEAKHGVVTRVTKTTQHFLFKKPQVASVIVEYLDGDRQLYTEVISNNGSKYGYRPA